MSVNDIIRAWKDPVYRKSLSKKRRALLPDNPIGLIELTDENLDAISGGTATACTHCTTCTSLLTGPCAEMCCVK
ncbi:MAG TPA: mersacidin/lichenicidin family type 2 lantibiotic [bacterium]